MRILTLGLRFLAPGLRARGHEVMQVGLPGTAVLPADQELDFFGAPAESRAAFRALAEGFRPDWILQVDDSTPLLHAGLEDLPFRKAWYAIDTHLHRAWHVHYAPLFDLVLCAQANLAPVLGGYRRTSGEGRVSGAAPRWLPLAAACETSFLPWAERRREVAFVGTVDPLRNPARAALLAALRAGGLPLEVRQGDFVPVYREARVVINQSVADDLNQRVFEAMACGALLLTDRISHSLEEIGEPGRDFLVYPPGDAAELARQARWALAHPAEAEAMARRGHARVVAGHMLPHRVDALLSALAGGGAPPGPPGHVLGHLAAAFEAASRLALPAPLPDWFAGESRRIAAAALAADPGSPWARLSLAFLELEAGRPSEARRRLDGAEGEGAGETYRRRYLFLDALLLAHARELPAARQALLRGLREFPGDPDLARLAGALGVPAA